MGFARVAPVPSPNTNACGGVAPTALLSAPRSNLMTSSNGTTSENETEARERRPMGACFRLWNRVPYHSVAAAVIESNDAPTGGVLT
ncbi:hypothetical protein Trydic_g12788 [Trypoxylus dichotomus]